MRKEFRVHMLNTEGINKANEIATTMSDALDHIEALIGPGPENARELALVRTHMELASFFAKKAMALLPRHQKAE